MANVGHKYQGGRYLKRECAVYAVSSGEGRASASGYLSAVWRIQSHPLFLASYPKSHRREERDDLPNV